MSPKITPRAARAAAASAALALLAACAAPGEGGLGGGATVFDVRPISSADEALASSRSGGLPVEVQGGDAAATAARLSTPQRLGGGGFAPVPAGSDGSRLVFAFGSASPESLCAGSGPVAAGAGEATAAWCLNDRVIASARGRSAAFAGPEAPGFERAASQLLRPMLAPYRGSSRRS
ncbi:MAG: hypothetical protein AAFU61_09435 [Pseudomonadota bacterium]